MTVTGGRSLTSMTNSIGEKTALGDITYDLSHLGKDPIDVHLKCSSAEETFDPAYYNGGNAVSTEFS